MSRRATRECERQTKLDARSPVVCPTPTRLRRLHGAELLEDVLQVDAVHSPREVAHEQLAVVVRLRGA